MSGMNPLRIAVAGAGVIVSDAAASARSWEHTSQENMAYATYPDEDCYVLTGTRGSLSFPTMRIKRYEHDEDRSWWKPMRAETVAVPRDDPLVAQLAHFCAVVRGEVAPLVAVQDGVQNLRVVDAIVEAARTRGVVDLAAAEVATA